jgi:hypothetical protein
MTAARGIHIALGVWLFISAFLWPHTYSQFTNAWIIGVLSVIFSVIAMWAPQARYLNAALAVWLFISAWALPSISVATIWNHVLVAIAIFVVSLLPATPEVPSTPTGAPRT